MTSFQTFPQPWFLSSSAKQILEALVEIRSKLPDVFNNNNIYRRREEIVPAARHLADPRPYGAQCLLQAPTPGLQARPTIQGTAIVGSPRLH